MRTIALLILLSLHPSTAMAQFVANYYGWRQLPQVIKFGYVMAMWDYASNLNTDNGNDQAVVDGLHDCTKALKPTAEMLIDTIDKHYQDKSNWGHSPAAAFNADAVYGVCKRHVNEQRKARGLPVRE